MKVEKHVEDRLEAKLQRWQDAQKKILKYVLIFCLLIVGSIFLDHLFLGFFIVGLVCSLLFAVYSFQRVQTLSNIKGHSWKNKDT